MYIPDTDPATPEPSVEDQALAAMDEGLSKATPEPAAPPADPSASPEGEAPAADPPADTAAPPADPVEPPADPAADPAAPKPEDKPPGTPEAAAADTAAVDKEVADLGLKGKSEARFRELTSQVKELAPVREMLEKHGIKDAAAELPRILEVAKAADGIVGMVMDTGATQEQYQSTLDYLSMVNSGDPVTMNKAFDSIISEAQALGKLIGREVPGMYDPLDDHGDLKAEVEAGDLPRARALEIARTRNAEKIATVTTTQRTEQQTAAEAQTQGRSALTALGHELAANDPDYARKQQYLIGFIQSVAGTLPPDKWAAAARDFYAKLPAMPAPVPPPAAKPPPGPMRGGLIPPAHLAPETDDPMAALDYGIRAASG